MPIGLDEPYRIVVGNNPVNFVDPLGLYVEGDPSGWGNPGYMPPSPPQEPALNPNGLICRAVCGLGTKAMCYGLGAGFSPVTGGSSFIVSVPCSIATSAACSAICPDPINKPKCP